MSRDAVLAALRESRSVIVTSHVSPDPDAVGSAGALSLALRELGKAATCYLADRVPVKMNRLVSEVGIVHRVPDEGVDLVVVVDTASRARVGSEGEILFSRACRTANIDHHVSNPRWADLNYIDSGAAATAEIIEHLLQELGTFHNRAIPNLLYAGLLDDTGSFRFSNTDPEALECAARLLRAGADALTVSNELYCRVPLKIFELRKRVHATLQLYHTGRFAVVTVSQRIFEETGTSAEDTDGMIDDLRTIDGTVVVALVREVENGWKASLRAKTDEVDVNAIAGRFGGGGHRAAAGCRIGGSLSEAIHALVLAVGESLPG